MFNSNQLTEKMTSELTEYPKINFWGNDIAEYSSLSKDPVVLKSQCFAKYIEYKNDPSKTVKCVGFVIDSKNGKCWLKNKLENKSVDKSLNLHVNSYNIGPDLFEYPKINYYGNDINTFNLTSSDPNVLKSECLAKCINHNNDPKNTRKCIGFSTEISTKKCMIKNKLEDKSLNPNVNSYRIGSDIIEYPETDFYGNDVANYSSLSKNPEELKYQCLAKSVEYNKNVDNVTKCVGFTISPKEGKCWLKSKLENKATDKKGKDKISYSINPELVEYTNTNFYFDGIDVAFYSSLSNDPEVLKSQCLAKFIDYNNDPKNTTKKALGFGIQPSKGKCWLKSKLENKSKHDGVHNYKVLN